MFAGIIEERGKVVGILWGRRKLRLELEAEGIYKQAKAGDSVSVNGVCLTLAGKKGGVLSFDVIEATLKRSNFNNLRIGDTVNLERALKVGDRVGGHIITGHVDCVGTVKRITSREPVELEIEIPGHFTKYVVEEGSIAVNGVSLTVGKKAGNKVIVYLIPHTLNMTNLGKTSIGEGVNIEFDLIGKYVITSTEARKTPGMTEEFLREKGFAY